jgi:SAM-dependent methyltransferase
MPDPTDHHAATDSHAADCCSPASRKIASHFDDRIAELTEESETDFPEMVDVSRTLLELLDDVGSATPTLLELGCGSGALTVALLKRGARQARGLDLSPGMLAVAVKRAAQADVADRVAFSLADAATADVGTADWVLMDRVICCYPHMQSLFAQASRAATRRVAFTVPTSRGWRGLVNKVMWRAENIPLRFGSSGCPGFVHSVDAMERTLAAAGFSLSRADRLGLWYAAVWDRPEVIA